jgi:hypothetical protein
VELYLHSSIRLHGVVVVWTTSVAQSQHSALCPMHWRAGVLTFCYDIEDEVPEVEKLNRNA